MSEKPKITEAMRDRLLRGINGGYLGMAWAVKKDNGKADEECRLSPGSWVVTENAYGYVFLEVQDDLTLVEYEVDYG
jgi:hypothetical protein